MKRRRRTLGLALAFCLAALCLTPSALANGWRLRGELVQYVLETNRWDEYTALESQGEHCAVMHTDYHNELLVALDGQLFYTTRAVYQPDDGRDGEMRLEDTENGFVLSYGPQEAYTFEAGDTGYVLVQAVVGGMTVTAAPGAYGVMRYTAQEDGQTVWWQSAMKRLEDFNIRLFPRSLEEIRHLNFMHAALDSGEAVCGWWQTGEAGRRYEGVGRGTAAVYSAPFGENAWRAANGKAAVGLEGTFWGMHTVRGDGQDYACIRYDISNRTQRIGFVLQSALGQTEEACPEWTEKYVQVPVRARETTYLTDDPQVSQYAQFVVPEGTEMTCLALYAQEYAFVAADALVDNGSILWGFVPLRTLELASEDVRQAVRHDVMAQMDGTWRLTAGGSMAAEELTLRADGTYVTYGEAPEEGVWYVTDYLAQWNLYWNDPPYELYLCGDDGSVNVRGLTLQEDGWSLSNWEGGGGWSRIDAP